MKNIFIMLIALLVLVPSFVNGKKSVKVKANESASGVYCCKEMGEKCQFTITGDALIIACRGSFPASLLWDDEVKAYTMDALGSRPKVKVEYINNTFTHCFCDSSYKDCNEPTVYIKCK